MTMNKKPTKNQIEKMAVEVRQFLLDHGIWQDVRIYFNGKAFSTDDGKNGYYYNDPKHLIVLEDMDPRDYFEYVNPDHILSMSFEGPLYDCLNGYGEYGYKFDAKVETGLSAIFAKYGCYYELGNAWNLTLYLN